ncbi:Rrf2 family transcriptional regulator [Candidatus Thiothrix sp. Deng01]|uniref:Rrf2 family transcriptional regulator n=1 Tax=Candidatus Thiothrix phosphatis TaxID=3112415 RepID=A0ABU6D1C8_9GAMM|nr:Rrf2 family transcriptional regulator [Candidatus Thiothrix sp. Deng01]MEB4592884.1 Rrf2 family transcriptional regulator [Candidatus Thiothrix sp. Deng01]
MKLSTQGQHAIMGMLALAVHEDEGAVRLGDLAEKQGISLSYLEQVFARLRNEGLVEGIRGPGGGYRLSRHADAITLADIVLAVEDEPAIEQRRQPADTPEQDLVQAMWSDLSKQFYRFMEDITLESLLEGHELPRKTFKMGETASMIARMFPAREPKPAFAVQMAM